MCLDCKRIVFQIQTQYFMYIERKDLKLKYL